MPLAPIKNRPKTRESKKNRIARRIKIAITVAVIPVLVIAGLAALYIWLKPVNKNLDQTTVSQNGPIPTIKKPPKLADNVPFGSSIQSITSSVASGANASITLRSLEGATCSIKVVHRNDMGKEADIVKDSGLADKTADEFGVTAWTWTMPVDAYIGEWQADVMCRRGDKSTRSVGEITVKRMDTVE